jgi:hypothetical protein
MEQILHTTRRGFPIKLRASLTITELAVVGLFLLLCMVPITISFLLIDKLTRSLDLLMLKRIQDFYFSLFYVLTEITFGTFLHRPIFYLYNRLVCRYPKRKFGAMIFR